jgi:hypothetical protein
MTEPLKVGDQYFLENLAEHFGHKVEIARYTDSSTGEVSDYRLHCAEPDCESPVGIAVEVVSIPGEIDTAYIATKQV